MPNTCLDDTGNKIVRELYRAVNSLTDDPGLLACIGSWGDTMDDADVLNELKHWNEMGEPFVPDVSVRAGDPRVADLLQTVADAATEAQKKVLDANLALNLVIIAVGEYGRLAFGDDYLDNLCTTLQRLRGKVPPDGSSH